MAQPTNITINAIGYGSNPGFIPYLATNLGPASDGTDGATEYALSCPAATCTGSATMIIAGPSTYSFGFGNFDDYSSYARTICNFTGSPTPTTGTCKEAATTVLGTVSSSTSTTYRVPHTDTLLGETKNIVQVTFAVTGLESVPLSTSTPDTTMSTGPTTSPVTITTAPSASSTAASVKGKPSSNPASRPGLPLLFLIGGLAGALAGI